MVRAAGGETIGKSGSLDENWTAPISAPSTETLNALTISVVKSLTEYQSVEVMDAEPSSTTTMSSFA